MTATGQSARQDYSRPLCWVTGTGGLIGNHLVQAAPPFAPQLSVRALHRADLDLLDDVAVRREFQKDKPRAIIHCAALTHTPTCQKNPELAWRANTEATARLAELSAEIPFVFFSTDLVFDGRKGNYIETDPVNPLNVYGETKAAAERAVLANPKHTVIRTSLNGGTSPTGDRGFNEILRNAFEKGQTLQLFTDEFRCPIAAMVTARATWELLRRNATGLYHLAGSERLSRWQIGTLLAQRWPQLKPTIEPMSVKDFTGAPRSPDTSTNCSKAQSLLSFPLPGLTEWLADHPAEAF